jgi:light-regulated signal transduction histidine kinase (bacteriophytochrome)
MSDEPAQGTAASVGPPELSALRLHNAQLQAELASVRGQMAQLRFKVAHDLRAPLRHVGAFALVIMEDFGPQLDEQVIGHLKTIQGAASQMTQMIDDLLADGPLGPGEI